MNVDPRSAIFHDEDKAREHFEALRWPDGKPFCPHCGADNVHRLEGKSHRPGLIQCNACMLTFTVTVGSVMESSHLPLTKWALAFHKMAASKKGISAKQMQRELALGSYRTAWFVCMRVREAMKLPKMSPGRIGGAGKVVESDETFVGGKKKNVHKGKPEPKKHAVHALVERGGHVRATHVADVSAKTLRAAIAKHVSKGTTMNTDEALAYYHMSKEFAAHGTVNHSAGEYSARTVSRTSSPQRRSSRSSSVASWDRSTASASSTCSATWTSSRSAGTRVRPWVWKMPNAPAA
jgi:transposase-like protein